jgi:DUF971 family protein
MSARSAVEINAGKNSPTVEIVWNDGHRSLYSVGKLRELCPCATCRESGIKPGFEPLIKSETGAEGSTKQRRGLPMFKPDKYQLANMGYVGSYALGVTWQDKHQSIYPWEMLSEECPCEECAARRKVASE